MKKILFFYPPNTRSVAIETLAEELTKKNFIVVFLTLSAKGDLHAALEKSGIQTYTFPASKGPRVIAFVSNIIRLIKFCYQHKIDVVWSHLQPANIIAVCAQFFIGARVVIFRHHFHAIIKIKGFSAVNKNERRMEKLICWLAKEIVVPSPEVYNGMVGYEKVTEKKITIIPYVYSFHKYPQPDEATVAAIRQKFAARLLIITASRMINLKRHDLVLPVYAEFIKKGYDIKVLLMDDGEERGRLEKYVTDHNLGNNIFFMGYRRDLQNYLAASDLLVHPSYTEASSSLVKEFGIFRKPVIVCDGVGDFSEYIQHGENGYLVTQNNNEAAQFFSAIEEIYLDPQKGRQLGDALHDTIIKRFTPNDDTLLAYQKKIE